MSLHFHITESNHSFQDYLFSLGDQTDLDDFHWINTFWWLLSDEASHASILYFQTGMLLTRHLQQMHKVLIDQHILLIKKVIIIIIIMVLTPDKMVYKAYKVLVVLHFIVFSSMFPFNYDQINM